MRKIITKSLFLIILLFITSCKQNTDEEETWDYVWSIEDVRGTWKASDSMYEYEVYVSIIDWCTVHKRFKITGDSSYSKSYFNSDAIYFIKSCKVNNKRNKLICPAFGSSVILTK